jgi:predicted alpha/beta-fold hydrolase
MTIAVNETIRGFGPTDLTVPPFEPHRWLQSAHAQTVVGRYWGGSRGRLDAAAHEIGLADGDRLLVLESIPPGWECPRPAAVLVHGLAGCADASYMVRVSRRLLQMGARVVRVNLRGAGQGFGLARGIYHAGRSDDLREVVKWLHHRIPGSPIGLVGFSLGANLVLKLAAEAADFPVLGLDCVLGANPPIHLASCVRLMKKPENRLYDWNFVRWLRSMVERLHRRFPELGPHGMKGVRSVYAFDDRYTAPRGGFRSADDYYEKCSLTEALPRIAVPGMVVHAVDDPFVAYEPWLRVQRQPQLSLELLAHGGHLGYLSQSAWLGDHHWLDLRLATWLKSRWADRLPSSIASNGMVSTSK